MPYSVKGFFEINEDMVQILLMLEVLFTTELKIEKPLNDFSSVFEIIIQECSLGDCPPKLLKPFRSVEQNGHQGFK